MENRLTSLIKRSETGPVSPGFTNIHVCQVNMCFAASGQQVGVCQQCNSIFSSCLVTPWDFGFGCVLQEG